MSSKDLPQVTLLCAQLGYPATESEVRERFEKIQALPSYGLFVARTEESVVVGWIQVNEEPETLLVGRRADIAALVVHEGHRSSGVGRALVGQAEQWAHSRGLPLLRVKSNVSREGAHRFYQREGYNLSKTSHMFVKVLFD